MRPLPSICARLPVTMPTFHDLSTFDLAILGIALVLCIRGLWIGCRRQIPAILALMGSYSMAGPTVHALLPWTSRFIASPKVTFLLAFGLIGLLGGVILSRLAKLLGRVGHTHRIGWKDRLLGLVAGGFTAVAVTSLLYMVLAATLSTTNSLLRTAQSGPFLRQGSEMLRSWIAEPHLRQSFLHKEPAIVPESRSGQQETPQPEAHSVKP